MNKLHENDMFYKRDTKAFTYIAYKCKVKLTDNISINIESPVFLSSEDIATSIRVLLRVKYNRRKKL